MSNQEMPDDRYYSVNVRTFEHGPQSWRASGRIFRMDTKEAVKGAVFIGADESAAKEKALSALNQELQNLSRPPFEWGKTKRRSVVQRYLQFKEGLTRISLEMQKQRMSGDLTEEKLHSGLSSIVSYVSKEVVALGRLVGELDEDDRNALSKTESTLLDQDGLHLSIDEMGARLDIRDLFLA